MRWAAEVEVDAAGASNIHDLRSPPRKRLAVELEEERIEGGREGRGGGGGGGSWLGREEDEDKLEEAEVTWRALSALKREWMA